MRIPFQRLLNSCFGCLVALMTLLVTAGCWQGETNVARGNREQVLHRAVQPDIADLDPHLASHAADTAILTALFEGLVTEDPVDLHPVPAVAESWEISPDGRTYTFSLRPNAKWSNGQPVTAGDFVASFRRALSPALRSDNSAFLYILQNAEPYQKGTLKDFDKVGVTAVNDRTLRLTLEYPSPTFLSRLTHTVFLPVPVSTIEKFGPVDQRGNAWARPGKIVTNGPFELVEWKFGQKVTVAKSRTYWDRDTVRLNGIQFHIIENRDAEERAFRAGQIHLTDTLPTSKVDAYRRNNPDVLRIDPYLAVEFYRINVNVPFLNDKKVRRALSLAIDRQSLVQNILRGGQAAAKSLTPPNTAGYTPAADLSFRPDEARALLREAGYADGKGAPSIELLFNPSESHRAVAEAIQAMWKKELGIEVKLTNQEYKTMIAARRTGGFQVLRSVWVADFIDPSSFLDIFTSQSGNNFTGWSNRTYDQLLFEAARVSDPSARNALLQKAEALLLDEAPVIPIYHYTHVFLLHPAVRNWHPTLLDHHPYKYVYLEAP
jgi:oligopeptide transport system substrate-binding protein